jgi:hypothetical protein
MIQVKVSKKLLENLIKYKINPHSILSIDHKFKIYNDRNTFNKIDITYTTPYLENKYIMTSIGKYDIYKEISYEKKILEVHYDSLETNLNETYNIKNKIFLDIEFLELFKF